MRIARHTLLLYVVGSFSAAACSFDTSAPQLGGDDEPGSFSPDAGGQSDAGRSLSPDAQPGATGPDAAPTVAEGTLQSFPLTTTLQLDGDLDAAWLEHAFISYDIDQAGQLLSIPGYAPDAVLRFASRYDADKVYFFFEVSDDLLVSDSSSVYNDDSIELYIDGLNDRSGPFGDDDHWLVIGETGSYQSLGTNNIAIAGFIKTTSAGYNIEISLDRAELGAAANASNLGFNIGINDDDGMGQPGIDAYGLWHLPSAPFCSDCCADVDGNFAWCDTTRLGQLQLITGP